MLKLLYPIGATLCTVLLLAGSCRAVNADESSSEIRFGIQGHYRIGTWTGVRYLGDENVTTLETRDGDGAEVPVSYTHLRAHET